MDFDDAEARSIGAARGRHERFANSIDAGLVETVKTLRIGGVLMRRGTYGATGSGANVTDATHFSGTGQINVLRGTESVISIR